MAISILGEYDNEFNYKIINDPIYGCIGLSETEVSLLDTRAMQRLRRIRQMGFTSYVFPSGEHSRFVHSLGVLFIAGKMCGLLYQKYGGSADCHPKFTIHDVRLIRIAALLHDIGHFPFSHLCEYVYSYIDLVKHLDPIIESSGVKANDEPHVISAIANIDKRKEKDHEHLSAEVIKKDPEILTILKKAGISPDEVGAIITGDYSVSANPIHVQLLHSSLDADRLDYLLRDSRQSGVSFGNVELDYILHQMRIERCPIRIDGIEEHIECIVFDERGQHAIEHFLIGRYFHYSQVILHKASMAFEAIAKALIYKVLNSAECTAYASYESILECIGNNDFYNFTDDFFWQFICTYAKSTEDKLLKDLWVCLSQRKKPVHVLTITDIIPKTKTYSNAKPINNSMIHIANDLIQKSQDALAREAGIEPAYIGFVESKVNLESISSHLRVEDCLFDEEDARGAIRIIDKDGKVSFLASDKKSLINKMVDFTSNTLDIFVIGDAGETSAEKLCEIINQKMMLHQNSMI